MNTTVDAVERLIGRMYTRFILRDLTFFLSGAIVLWLATGEAVGGIPSWLGAATSPAWLSVSVFLAIAYVAGVLMQEAWRVLLDPLSRLYIAWRTRLKRLSGDEVKASPLPRGEETSVERMAKVRRAGHSEDTLAGIERILFIKQIASTQLSVVVALIVSTERLGISSGQTLLVWLAIPLCIWVYIDKARQQDQAFKSLSKRAR